MAKPRATFDLTLLYSECRSSRPCDSPHSAHRPTTRYWILKSAGNKTDECLAPQRPLPRVHLVLVAREPLRQFLSVVYFFIGRHRYTADQRAQLLEEPNTLTAHDASTWLVQSLSRHRDAFVLHQLALVVLAPELRVREAAPGAGIVIQGLNVSAAAAAAQHIEIGVITASLTKFAWLSTLDDVGKVKLSARGYVCECTWG